jgi:glutamine synthetase
MARSSTTSTTIAEAQGLEIDGILQEGGAGQIELNLAHGDPIRLADDVFFFKRLIREAALRHDCFATFMAKPIAGEPGSAMHIHTSVVDTKTGKNIFAGPKGVETEAFLNFIGGLQKHLGAAVALFAPYVNSYRRYVPDFAAPSIWNGAATTAPPACASRSPARPPAGWKTACPAWTATPISASPRPSPAATLG